MARLNLIPVANSAASEFAGVAGNGVSLTTDGALTPSPSVDVANIRAYRWRSCLDASRKRLGRE